MDLSGWDWVVIILAVVSVIGNTFKAKEQPAMAVFNALWGLLIGCVIWK